MTMRRFLLLGSLAVPVCSSGFFDASLVKVVETKVVASMADETLIREISETEAEPVCDCNETNETTGGAPVEEEMSTLEALFGTILAITGGSLYAVGALIVSFATRGAEQGTMEVSTQTTLKRVSLLTMCTGGVCVTVCYMTGASVPLMNAIVYATNLNLNMCFQIIWRLSPYTKNMRCGTLLFALAAFQLGQLAPPPFVPTPEQFSTMITATSSIVWNIVFLTVYIGSGFLVAANREKPKTDNLKTIAWALHVASWGSATDNWAKWNGTISGTLWYVSMGIYFPVGVVVMMLSVQAMAGTRVSIYVPCNLCMQLVLNTLAGLFIWEEGTRVEKLVPYLMGYVICIMAVYITTETADLGASMSNARELRNKRLSDGEAKTPFGEAMVAMCDKWNNASDPTSGTDIATERMEAIKETLVTGSDTKAFDKDDIADLVLRLWGRVSPSYMPLGSFISWLDTSEFMDTYFQEDAKFKDVLCQSMSGEEKSKKDAGSAVGMDDMEKNS